MDPPRGEGQTPGRNGRRVLRQGAANRQVPHWCCVCRRDAGAVSRISDHARLPLPATYEEFVSGLGYTTRRNFRYCRRRSDAAGNHYVDRLPAAELESAAEELRTKSKLPTSASELRRVLNMMAASDLPFSAGLRDSRGRLPRHLQIDAHTVAPFQSPSHLSSLRS